MNNTINRPTTRTRATPDPNEDPTARRNERLALARIEHGITMARIAGQSISTSCARLIATAIHRGPTTALSRFAATGRLAGVDLMQAQQELWDAPVDEIPTPWWRALDLYLTELRETETAR